MRRVMIIGAGVNSAKIAAALTALGIEAVGSHQQFRALASSLPSMALPEPRHEVAPAPKFGGDRPYLKKKKGRP